jgi:hypothetical protein
MDKQSSLWVVRTDYASKAKFERFFRSYSREYASVFANLDKIQQLLNSGNKIGGFHVGFFRPESDGVHRIGQTGVESAKETRLYIYPDDKNRVIHVLGIGTKDGQQDDINEAKQIVGKIRSSIGT